jgi:hypothetical protein
LLSHLDPWCRLIVLGGKRKIAISFTFPVVKPWMQQFYYVFFIYYRRHAQSFLIPLQ